MLLIFDWDGTLMDSERKILASMRAAAHACSLAPPEDAAVRNIIGLELSVAIAQLFPEESELGVAAIRAGYVESFVAADQQPCSLFPQVAETLAELAGQGHQLCVATGKSRKGLNRVFSHLPEANFFVGSRCADETASKPDPTMLRELCEEFSVSPELALMVGDTEYDLEMAARIGMPAVGVSYGAHEASRLLRWGPLAVIDQFAELIDHVSG